MSEMRITHNPARITPYPAKSGVRRAAVYCRVSTLYEEQEDSYETQCEYYRRFIDADPSLSLAGIYGDRGVSGLRAEKRPAFQRMLKDCLGGAADVVFTKSISRFARSIADCARCVKLLALKGIPVIFEKEGINSMEKGGEFVLCVLGAIAQEESNNLSQNILWSFDRLNSAGTPARAARYGYRKSGVGRGWQVYEPEAKRVRLAFNLATHGLGYTSIAAALDEMESREGSRDRWSLCRVRDMLSSEVYIGDILTNKGFKPDYLSDRFIKNTGQRAQYYIEGHHEPIVDRDTFARARAITKRRFKI